MPEVLDGRRPRPTQPTSDLVELGDDVVVGDAAGVVENSVADPTAVRRQCRPSGPRSADGTPAPSHRATPRPGRGFSTPAITPRRRYSNPAVAPSTVGSSRAVEARASAATAFRGGPWCSSPVPAGRERRASPVKVLMEEQAGFGWPEARRSQGGQRDAVGRHRRHR